MKNSFNSSRVSLGKKNHLTNARTVFGDVNVGSSFGSSGLWFLSLVALGLGLGASARKKGDVETLKPVKPVDTSENTEKGDTIVLLVTEQPAAPEMPVPASVPPVAPEQPAPVSDIPAPAPTPSVIEQTRIINIETRWVDSQLVKKGLIYLFLLFLGLILLWFLLKWGNKKIDEVFEKKVEAKPAVIASSPRNQSQESTLLSEAEIVKRGALNHCGDCEIIKVWKTSTSFTANRDTLLNDVLKSGVSEPNGNIVGRRIQTNSRYLIYSYPPKVSSDSARVGNFDTREFGPKGVQTTAYQFLFRGKPVNTRFAQN